MQCHLHQRSTHLATYSTKYVRQTTTQVKLYAHIIGLTTYSTTHTIQLICIKLLCANIAWYFLKFSPILQRIFISVSQERGFFLVWQRVECGSDAFMLAWYSLTHTSRESHSIYQGQIDSHASAILRLFHTPCDGVQVNRPCVRLLMPLRRLDGVCGTFLRTQPPNSDRNRDKAPKHVILCRLQYSERDCYAVV